MMLILTNNFFNKIKLVLRVIWYAFFTKHNVVVLIFPFNLTQDELDFIDNISKLIMLSRR